YIENRGNGNKKKHYRNTYCFFGKPIKHKNLLLTLHNYTNRLTGKQQFSYVKNNIPLIVPPSI
ncbi:MAG TPA: hypothetical protein PK263_00945, partial [bacterium]|nr:hypothetical protein [bacterium]